MGSKSALSWEPMPSEENVPLRDANGCSLDAYYRLAACDLSMGQEPRRFTPVDEQLYDPFVRFFPYALIVLGLLEYGPSTVRFLLTLYKSVVG